MSLKKFFTIATIGAVTLGSAVGIGIAVKGAVKSEKVNVPGDYTEVYSRKDKNYDTYHVVQGTHFQIEAFGSDRRTSVLGDKECRDDHGQPIPCLPPGITKWRISLKGWVYYYSIHKRYFTSSFRDSPFFRLLFSTGWSINHDCVWGEGACASSSSEFLPTDFYFSIYAGIDAHLTMKMWVPTEYISHTETVNDHNRQYDAPVSNFSTNGDNHQYRSEREREVTTNSYWYKHRDKLTVPGKVNTLPYKVNLDIWTHE